MSAIQVNAPEAENDCRAQHVCQQSDTAETHGRQGDAAHPRSLLHHRLDILQAGATQANATLLVYQP
jgi:hypothetical protein